LADDDLDRFSRVTGALTATDFRKRLKIDSFLARLNAGRATVIWQAKNSQWSGACE
jgi:hypothetical protein